MSSTLVKSDYNFPQQTNVYKGKVRDVYSVGKDLLVMVASDRISAFDVILPKGIPFKGQVLNQIAAKFLLATADIVPNWLAKAKYHWEVSPKKAQLELGLQLTPFEDGIKKTVDFLKVK